MNLRSKYDREILLLALPALGALASEPLYVLVDTAIVGHLGTNQLASLAIAATVLSTAFTIFNFLTYGTTAQVARLHGAGRDADAAALGSQALWLALGIGVRLLALLELFAPVDRAPDGRRGGGRRGRGAVPADLALGAPLFILASAAQGFLRGMGDLRTPLLILVAAHSVNVGLELLFVYGFGWGLAGWAWARDRPGRDGRRVLRGPVPGRARASAPGQDAPADADRVRDRRPHHRADRVLPRRLGRAGPDRRRVARRAPDRVPALGLPGADPRRDRDRRAGDGRPDARARATRRRAGGRGADDRLVGDDRRASAWCCSRSATSCRSCSPTTRR